MNGNCVQCASLKQASDDATRVETIMLAQKFLASANGDGVLLAKMESLLGQASKLRREARHAFHDHEMTHGDDQTHGSKRPNKSGAAVNKRAVGSN